MTKEHLRKIGVNGKICFIGKSQISENSEPFAWFDEWGLHIGHEEKMKRLPSKYIINKGATILFWDDNEDEKTIVKLSENDKYDKRLGFLTAYFQYNSGLTKTQANKYLDNLIEENKQKKK